MWRYALVVAVGMAWAVLTVSRVGVWHDETRLWHEAAIHAPNKPRPLINLGRQYALNGQPDEAERAYRAAWARLSQRPEVEQRAGRPLVLANLAALRVGQPEAVTLSLRAHALAPHDPEIWAMHSWIARTVSR